MAEQKRPVFGIDLGTTYSSIAYIDSYQQPVVIANAEGEKLTPSVVLFEAGSRIVGREAQSGALEVPDQVVAMIKRQMGAPDWRFEYEGQQYTAEEISAYILRKLAQDAGQQIGLPVVDVVITCPAYFGITQREATARAGEIAGLRVWEVINEPTAAAIAYGLEQEQEQVVLVYDLGGGTFDVTVIELKQNTIRVIATGGEHTCGGRDWDEAIVLYLAQEWKRRTGISDDPLESLVVVQDLWQKAEAAKRVLTSREETSVLVTHAGQRVEVPLTRQLFQKLTASLLEQTIFFTVSTIEQARRQGCPPIDRILLVGGSTRMPQVMERLQEAFHLPMQLYDPDESVAKGAAIYGQKLQLDRQVKAHLATPLPVISSLPQEMQRELAEESAVQPHEMAAAQQAVAQEHGLELDAVKKFNDLSITNVASRSFGILARIKVYGQNESREVISNQVLVNAPLPCSKRQRYSVLNASKGLVEIKIIENMLDQEIVDDPSMGETIGTIQLPLPAGFPSDEQIDVFFALNTQGRLYVVGHEPSTNRQIEASFETRAGISAPELEEAQARQPMLFIA